MKDELDQWCYHGAIDRVCIISKMIEEILSDHIAVEHAGGDDDIDNALHALTELYKKLSKEKTMNNNFGQQNQLKYKRGDKDLIDRWHERYSIEEFRVLMWAMMEKYNERLGKKDCPAQEVAKIADFAARWAEKEESQ